MREQYYFSVRPPSVHLPECYLLQNHWAEFNQNWLHHFSFGLGYARATLFFRMSARPSVRPSSVHLSVTQFPPKPVGGIQSNVQPSWLGCARVTLFYSVSVRPSFVHLSVTLSLLNHWRNLIKLATSLPLIVGVCESNIIFPCVRRPSICPSRCLLLNPALDGIQPNLLHHFPSCFGCARATLFFSVSVRPSFVYLSVTLSPPKPLAEFNQTCYITSPHGIR